MNKRHSTTLSDKLLLAFPFVNMFSALSIYTIDTFNFSPPFILSVLYILVTIFETPRYGTLIKKNNVAMYILFVELIFLAYISNTDASLKSFLLYLYFATFYLLLFKERGELIVSQKYILAIIYVGSFINALGIIQFICQFTPVGYLDLSFGEMASVGYNTTAEVYSSIGVLLRAHSIYLEPSILSQQCFLVIVLAFYLFANKSLKIMPLTFIIGVNILAAACSISGTGIVHGALALAFLVLVYYGRKPSILFFIFIAMAVLIYSYNDATLYEFFWSRLSEGSSSQTTSGFIRFVIPWSCLVYSIFNNGLGVGPGCSYKIIHEVYPEMNMINDFNSGWPKVGVEAGIITLLIYIMFEIGVFKSARRKNNLAIAIFILFLAKEMTDGTVLTESYIYIVFVLIMSGVQLDNQARNEI